MERDDHQQPRGGVGIPFLARMPLHLQLRSRVLVSSQLEVDVCQLTSNLALRDTTRGKAATNTRISIFSEKSSLKREYIESVPKRKNQDEN
eukprot:3519529-Amphidinium_carterae.1